MEMKVEEENKTENVISVPRRIRKKCEHGKRKQICVQCCGSFICIHKKQRQNCRECGSSYFCVHDRKKINCRECNGCEHGKLKSRCVDCGGSSICIHKKKKIFALNVEGLPYAFTINKNEHAENAKEKISVFMTDENRRVLNVMGHPDANTPN